MIRRLNFVGVPVRDQARALEFYTEKLGLRVETDQHFGEGQRWIELSIPGAETRLVLFTPKGQEDRVGTFFNGAFGCEDVQKTFQELSARGVEFPQPPKKEPWGWSAMIKDSEGNTFVLGTR